MMPIDNRHFVTYGIQKTAIFQLHLVHCRRLSTYLCWSLNPGYQMYFMTLYWHVCGLLTFEGGRLRTSIHPTDELIYSHSSYICKKRHTSIQNRHYQIRDCTTFIIHIFSQNYECHPAN